MAGLQKKKPSASPPASSTKPEPHRFRVSVPVADEAVVAWMNLQDDRSLSVRMLIRESIERLGYVDVVNRPVEQLPKRGRPSGQEGDGTYQVTTPAEHIARVKEMGDDIRSRAAGEAVGSAPAFAEPDPGPTDETERELLGIALQVPTLRQEPEPDRLEPQEAASPVPDLVSVPPAPEPEQPSGGQMDVQDIFRSTRV